MRLLRKSSVLSAALAVSLLAMGASAQDAAASDLPNLSTATQINGKTSADTNTDTSAATTAALPKLPSSGPSNSRLPSLPTNLPTLTGVATIVTPVVPNTKQAPFMQQSTMPDGTVFIIVGAILGFMATSVLLWRGLVAWALHRSVKRAALAQNTAMNDTKTLFRTPGPPPPEFYKYKDRESTISLGLKGHKSGKKEKRGNRTTSTAGAGAGVSASNLFFSPTAGAATASLSNAGNRGSNYLPAGYYAAGAAQAGAGQSHVTLGHQPSISLSNLQQMQGYPRANRMGETPPDSPADGAQSSSTLNLSQGYGAQERAPSAFLEDLFDGENGPPVPGHHQRAHSGSPRY
ncbi:hypothetical protein BGZ57DRAFT_902313 [Hyaloscypha finlandica]|nr:hypothetical protein BGZ57DRAFT_902313 [Hyaloscypha finlandica]